MTTPETSAPADIAVIVGSLRKRSLNRQLAKVLQQVAPATLRLELVEIGQLPFYNQDLEVDPAPPEWTAFRERLRRARGVIFVTPEYNRSVPAVLKNAIDVGSRPYGKSIWATKPTLVISASPGAIGGFGANHHLRQSLVTLNAAVLPAPEAYIGGADKLFDDAGELTNASTREFLSKLVATYADWFARNTRG
jgi:chromate reductase